jgi:hypothetical protein
MQHLMQQHGIRPRGKRRFRITKRNAQKFQEQVVRDYLTNYEKFDTPNTA